MQTGCTCKQGDGSLSGRLRIRLSRWHREFESSTLQARGIICFTAAHTGGTLPSPALLAADSSMLQAAAASGTSLQWGAAVRVQHPLLSLLDDGHDEQQQLSKLGHASAITCVALAALAGGRQYLLSADSLGLLKLWKLRLVPPAGLTLASVCWAHCIAHGTCVCVYVWMLWQPLLSMVPQRCDPACLPPTPACLVCAGGHAPHPLDLRRLHGGAPCLWPAGQRRRRRLHSAVAPADAAAGPRGAPGDCSAASGVARAAGGGGAARAGDALGQCLRLLPLQLRRLPCQLRV